MASDFRTYYVNGFQETIDTFVKDIEALSHEDLSRVWGNGARCAYDFAYEVGVINRRVAFRCKGEDPGPMPWEFGKEWLKAPEEMRNKAAVIDFIKSTGAEVLASVGDDMERPVTAGDETAPAYQRLAFSTYHTAYHDAQLNFIQSMVGDMDIHW